MQQQQQQQQQQGPCRHGTHCYNRRCQYSHPPRDKCRYGVGCNNAQCTFEHSLTTDPISADPMEAFLALKDAFEPEAVRLSPMIRKPGFWEQFSSLHHPLATSSMRILVSADTVQLSCAGGYARPDGVFVPLPISDIQHSVSHTRLLTVADLAEQLPAPKARPAPCLISICRADSLEVAAVAVTTTPHVAVLNLASHEHAGGGYRWGTNAQEECLFRRSTYACSLEPQLRNDSDAIVYPFPKDDNVRGGAVISPRVLVFRETEERQYEVLPQPFAVDMIAAAAVKNPRLLDGRLTQHDMRRTAQRIDSIFRAAVRLQTDVLVLGALGCGAYGNPPEDVARLFLDALQHYAPYFRAVVFAILDRDGRLSSTFQRVLRCDIPSLQHLDALLKGSCDFGQTQDNDVQPLHFSQMSAAAADDVHVDVVDDTPPTPKTLGNIWGQPDDTDAALQQASANFNATGPVAPFDMMALQGALPEQPIIQQPEIQKPMSPVQTLVPPAQPAPVFQPLTAPLVHHQLPLQPTQHHHGQHQFPTQPQQAVEPPVWFKASAPANKALHQAVHNQHHQQPHQQPHLYQHQAGPAPPQTHTHGVQTDDLFASQEDGEVPLALAALHTAHHPQLQQQQPCKDGAACTLWASNRAHMDQFTHPTICRYGFGCREFATPSHMGTYMHPFLFPCRYGVLCREQTVREHTAKFSHPCKFGSKCMFLKQKDADHCRFWLHLPACRHANDCKHKTDAKHLTEFSHPDEVSQLCKYGAFCLQMQVKEHTQKYVHPSMALQMCDIRGCNRDVNFIRNRNEMLSDLNKLAGGRFNVNKSVLQWIQQFRPCHRMNAAKFQSMMKMGAVVSLTFLQTFAKSLNQAALTTARCSPEVNTILSKCRCRFPTIKAWCKNRIKGAILKSAGKAIPQSLQDNEHAECQKLLQGFIRDAACMSGLKQAVDDIVTQACAVRDSASLGIGYHVDQVMKTNEQVFTVVGPHSNNQGGTDYGSILLIFSQSLMYHPDFSVTPCAATSFYSGGATSLRSWDSSDQTSDPYKWFNSRKMNAAIPGWDVVLAAEMQAAAQARYGGSDLQHVMELYQRDNTHHLLEGHLPGVVPFGYLEAIVMNQTTHDSLPAAYQEALTRMPLRSLVRVVPGADNVLGPAMRQHMVVYRNPRTVHQGFCVSLENAFLGERVLPMRSKQPGVVKVKFMATGHDIRVLLTDSPAPARARGPDAVLYEIAIDCRFDGDASRTWIRRTLDSEAFLEFSDGFRAADHHACAYSITFIEQRGLIVLKRRTAGRVVKLTAVDKKPHTGIRCVQLTCWRQLVAFTDIAIR